MRQDKVQRRLGDIVVVPLRDRSYGYGRVLTEPLMAFYDFNTPEIVSIEDVIKKPIAFTIFVMNYAVVNRLWPVIGNSSLDGELLIEPRFFKKDPISKRLSIYRDSTGEEIPASRTACERLECAAVWDPDQVVDRLLDHFQGRPNKWAEALRP